MPFDTPEKFSSPVTDVGLSPVPPYTPPAEGVTPGTFCGLKKKTFFIGLGIAAVVIIAALAGGLGGGLAAARRNSHNNSPVPTGDKSTGTDGGNGGDGGKGGSSNVTVTPPIPKGPIQRSQRRLAVSGSVQNTTNQIQLFYQHMNTSDMWYQRIEDDEPQGRHNLSLSIAPNWGTPLAAGSFNTTDPNSITAQLFYIHTDSKATNIVQATFECSTKDDTCETKSNNIISSNITDPIHPDTKLSATRIGSDFVRVYYQMSSKELWVLNGDMASTKGWLPRKVADDVYDGSNIASYAYLNSPNYLYLMYVSSKDNRLHYVVYDDVPGPGPCKSSPLLCLSWA